MCPKPSASPKSSLKEGDQGPMTRTETALSKGNEQAEPLPEELHDQNQSGCPGDADEPAVAAVSPRKFFFMIAVGLGLVGLIHLTPLGDRLSFITDLDTGPLADRGGMAMVWFVSLTALLMTVGVPRLLFYAFGGLAFDFWLGLQLALLGSMLGSFLAFRAARWAGRDWLLQRFGHRKMFAKLAQTRPTATAVAMVRMLPVSNFLLNVGLSLSRVRNRDFLLGTFIGFLPQGVVACLVGSGVGDESLLGASAQIVAACVIVLLFSYWSTRKLRARRQIDQSDSP